MGIGDEIGLAVEIGQIVGIGLFGETGLVVSQHAYHIHKAKESLKW